MLVEFWVLQCVFALCCISGIALRDARSSEMKTFPLLVRRIDRSVRALGSCTDINNKEIHNGNYYVPPGENACRHCKCVFGDPQECYTTNCAVPTCTNYKPVAGQCCRFTCPEEKSGDTQLAVIISLSLGLILLLILLIVVITRNIKNRQRNNRRPHPPIREEQGEEQRNNNADYIADPPLNNQLPTIQEEQERQFEPPPPYTPVHKIQERPHPPVIPNEPPPPYEIPTPLRATTV